MDIGSYVRGCNVCQLRSLKQHTFQSKHDCPRRIGWTVGFLSVVSAQMKTKVSLNTSVFLTRNKKLLFNVQRELNAAKVAKH